MISITRTLEFDMGHRIPDHQSKCRFLHGHRYRAEFTISGWLIENGPSAGMVLDFGDIKKAMVEVIEGGFDHRFALCQTDPICAQMNSVVLNYGVIVLPVIPTVENLAKLLGDEVWENLEKRLPDSLGPPLELHPEYGAKIYPNTNPYGVYPVSFKLFETPNCWAIYNFQSS